MEKQDLTNDTNLHAQNQTSACQIEFVICVEERSILWEMILVL